MKRQWAFWGIAVGYGAAFMLPVLVAEGTFLDGQIYATLARNLAEGRGAFWAPHYTPTVQPEWYEHPPLGLNIMAVFYRVLGDGVWVEHVYSAFTAVVCGWLIVVVWRLAAGEDERLRRLGWLPVLLWLMNPQVTWAYSNAMLENTMTIFTLAATGLLLRACVDERRWALLTAAGAAAIVAAGLTKGSVGLFPLATFGAWQLATGRLGWRRAIGYTALLLACAAALLGAVLLIPAARHGLAQYFDTQFVQSLSGRRGDTGNRLMFLVKLLNTLLPALGVALVLLGVAWWRRRLLGTVTRGSRDVAMFFLLLGLAGSVPLVVSPRQSLFYVLPSFPCYALGLACLAGPPVAAMRPGRIAMRVWNGLAVVLLAGALVAAAPRIGKVGRSVDMIHDVKLIGARLHRDGALAPGAEYAVGACPRLDREWGLDANLARYWRVGVAHGVAGRDYLVGVDGCLGDDAERYERLDLGTRIYHLHRRR